MKNLKVSEIKVAFTNLTGLEANSKNAAKIAKSNNQLEFLTDNGKLNGRNKQYWLNAVAIARRAKKATEQPASQSIESDNTEKKDYLALAKLAKQKQIESDNELRKTLLTPRITNHPTYVKSRSELVQEKVENNNIPVRRLDPVKGIYAKNSSLHSVGVAYCGTVTNETTDLVNSEKVVRQHKKANNANHKKATAPRSLTRTAIKKSVARNYKARVQAPKLYSRVQTSNAYRLDRKKSNKTMRDIFSLYGK